MNSTANLRSLRIVLFIDSLVAGGAQRQVVETALQLARCGHSISVVIYHNIRELGADLADAGVDVILVEKNAKMDLGFLWRLYRCFCELRPEVLHCFLFTPNLWGRLIGRAAGIRVVITSERNVDLPQSRVRVWLEKVVYRFGDCIVVNAEAIRHVLINSVAVPTERIRTVYNGVDVARFVAPPAECLAKTRNALGINPDDLVVTLPGRVMPQKNHACLLRALARLDQALRQRIRVLFVGNMLDEPYRQGLVRLAQQLGLESCVSFAGRRDDMASVYAISEVVVLPSLWEGFPNVLLEAMAAKRPVIASAIADNGLLLNDGLTGFLFPSDDDAALAVVLQKLFAMTPADRTAFGQAAHSSVLQRFGTEALVDANVAIYREFCVSGRD